MNVNEKGVRGLIKVIDDLADKGFYTFPAFDDHSPIDVVAVNEVGKAYRLQVKYRTRMANRKTIRYELVASSVVNGKKIPIDRVMIDGWAIYLAELKKVLYIPLSALDNKKVLIINPDVDYGFLFKQ